MKLKPSIILAAVVATFGWPVLAQTNVAPVIPTNLIKAPDSLRDVNGGLYVINQVASWETMNGDLLKVSTNGIVISTFTMEPIYQATTVTERMHPDRDYLHASDAHNDERLVAKRVQVGDKKVPGKKIILLNYPTNLYPADGQTISFRAMRIGTSNYNGNTLELWDYGTIPTQDELRKLKDEADERQKAAKKELDQRRRAAAQVIAAKKQAEDARVINWLLSQATNGSESAQYSLGLRYLKGEGVPKDEKQSREWLGKAATQGSKEAAVALSKLNQISTKSPATMNAAYVAEMKAPQQKANIVRQGDIQVSIEQLFISSDVNPSGRLTKGPLVIQLKIENLSSTRIAKGKGWSGGGGAVLADNFGNTYERNTYVAANLFQTPEIHEYQLYPRKTESEFLYFYESVTNIEWLHLELSAVNFGGNAVLRFEIPANSIPIKRWPWPIAK